jgi:hypothetical protein
LNSKAAFWLVAGMLGSGAAMAADHPPFLPTRDVAVDYQVEVTQSKTEPQAPHSVKVAYSAASGRVRIEQATAPGYMLIDRAGGSMTLVMEPMQSYMNMPFDSKAGAGLLLNDKMKFTRAGSDKVAGLSCNLWDVVSDSTTARLCITDDGVVLRGQGSDPKRGEGKLLATSVSYASQPATRFNPPQGFNKMEMPALPPGLMGKMGKPPG